jgi:hypothetical protein
MELRLLLLSIKTHVCRIHHNAYALRCTTLASSVKLEAIAVRVSARDECCGRRSKRGRRPEAWKRRLVEAELAFNGEMDEPRPHLRALLEDELGVGVARLALCHALLRAQINLCRVHTARTRQLSNCIAQEKTSAY